MKRIALVFSVLVCALPLLVSAALAGDHPKSNAGEHPQAQAGWFDFENCVFCKSLTEDPGLLEHTTWETHAIKNGMITIMTVQPEYAASMAKAEHAMQELGMKMQKGEVNPMGMKMCGHCQTFGMLMMGGQVDMEEVRGEAAIVSLSTSKDPAVVKQLHDISKRNNEEMAKMGGSHSGDGHGGH